MIASLYVVACLFFPSTSYAQANTPDSFGLTSVGEEINISTQTTDIRVTIVRVINIFLGFLGLIAVLIVMYAGYLWMTAGGDDEQIGVAKKLLINGAIGFTIIVSAFLITSFILSRLQEAVSGGDGGSGGGDTMLEGSCSEPGTPYYEQYHNTSRCNGFCSLYPLQCCTADNFVVKSITPHTPGSDESTQMNNAVIRVLFSKQVAGPTGSVFKIYRRENGQNTDISSDFTFSFVEDGSLVEAKNAQGNIPNGEYVIEVNEGVRDVSGRLLTTETSCGSFSRVGTFKTGDLGTDPVIDSVFGFLSPVSINGSSGNDVYSVVQGQEYSIKTTLRDDRGNAYAYLKIYKEGEAGIVFEDFIDGPRLLVGSSKPFDFIYGIRITSKFSTGVVYVAEVTAHDIDGNTATVHVRFRTVPPTCLNGVLDPGESSIDEGGPCGGSEGNSCTSQSDCATSLKCLDSSNAVCTAGSNSCMCKAVPYISDVQYMNGSAGNWITILGKHFGATPGVVRFNYDLNGDGSNDSSVTASLAQCRAGQVWNNSWIIAEVPLQPEGSSVSPHISVTDVTGLSDATNDTFGPNLGLFTYNDTKRPNLCSVTVSSDRTITLDDGSVTTIHAGDQSAPEGTPVVFEGKAFGSSQGTATFGVASANITSWSGELINSAVPFGGEGVVSTYITSNNAERSNPVPFTIAALSNLYPPTITSIDPATTTKGSYITISGNRFGNTGNVYFTNNEAVSCPGAGCFLAARLSATCGNAWSDTQIIAKVPLDQEFVLGKYFVTVQRNDGVNTLTSSGKDSIGVVTGEPRPSICRIDPRRGYAPLSQSGVVTLYGENFLQNSQVKFWYPLGNWKNPDSWLSTSVGATVGGATIVHTGPQKIETKIPYDTNSGLSMSSGPIKVKNGVQLFSNGINYDVLDCRESSSSALPGFQCCSEGPDAGRWKQVGFACAGVSREAGYVWRFTTGKTPQKFVVVESCSASGLPSPSPSTLWDSGKNVCLNAQLQVRFNLPVNPVTARIPNISINTCGESNGAIDCSPGQVTSLNDNFTAVPGGYSVILKPSEGGALFSPNTWYRIGLDKAVSSLEVNTEFGVSTSKSNSLEQTRPCEMNGRQYAYCFDFKTGAADFTCSLIGAGMEPSTYTTHLLGVVQDPRYNFVLDINRLFNISNLKPFAYFVYGKSSLACTSINVDTKPWVWGPVLNAPATAKHLDSYPNSYGYATAWQHTPLGTEIHADITEGTQQITATSTLIIDLGDPYAKNVWPSCLEACVNAEIGVEFNQLMNKGDFNASHITVRKCENENCIENGLGPVISLNINSGSQSDVSFRVYPSTPLEKNSWYLVDMGEGIRSIGAITDAGPPPVVKFGSSATPRKWKFKTKDSSQLCLADSVHVQPDPFYSTFIGETQLYKAFPVGSPDACSPYGQQLNPWNFGWNWSVENQHVAKVTNFSFDGSSKSTCTIGCTPAGSDISKTQNSSYTTGYPVCGNGRKDSGEDCDIKAPGEIPGVSCTFSCLRPGNKTKATVPPLPGQCGNGSVEPRVGEECDPAATGALLGYCTDMCTNKGSSGEQTGDPTLPVCGSASATDNGITYGEDCDIADPASKENCSKQCLNLGTQLSQDWCDIHGVDSQFNEVCQNALSVCGNTVVEQGEECEIDTNGKDNCSDQCLVQNACGTELQQCILGTEGCLSDCTFAGSSVTYSTPSVCGDGSQAGTAQSIGEYHGNGDTDIRSCELPLGQARNVLGGNPVQVVAAVGDAISSGSAETVSDLETKVKAETATALSQETGRSVSIAEVSGTGEYHLQCGYTELVDATTTPYNNCPNNEDDNTFGVGLNSCCMRRPERIDQYPAPNAGVGIGSAPICRNTYIEVVFDQNIPLHYLQNNIQLVQSYPQGYACNTHGGQDVSLDMRNLLALEDAAPHNFFARVWDAIKNFIARLIRIRVFAETEPNIKLPNNFVWCTTGSPSEISVAYETSIDNQIIQTTVSVYPTKALESNQYVVVLLNGGKDGIKNIAGVSIRSPFGPELSDYWLFKTNDQVCKIKEVSVDPAQALYTIPNSGKDFVATAVSTYENQLIVSTTEYAWKWNWAPQNDLIFTIPVVSAPTTTITSKGVRGHTDGIVEAQIVKDMLDTDNQTGKSFSTTYSLDAIFCQRPWPASGVDLSEDVVETDTLFEDTKYNFSMYYCADSGSPLSVLDDLPYFNTIEIITDPQELGLISGSDLPQALRRYLMFADKTDDAIGLQIFANSVKNDGSRQTLEEWYIDKFGDIGAVKKANIAGYNALTNEYNIYINAFNIDGESIYNNIYLFSIDTSASSETKQVFQQLINSLKFNTNLTNFERCLKENVPGQNPYTVRETPDQFNPSLACTTDFDCRDELSGEPKIGTNGICSNAATKFSRDMIRLEQMDATEERTDESQTRSVEQPRSNVAKVDLKEDPENHTIRLASVHRDDASPLSLTNDTVNQNFEKPVLNHLSVAIAQSAQTSPLNLSTGTYIPGYTNSKWPSWGKLGSLISGVPIDPVNRLVGCDGDGYDPNTCWNVASTTYKCPTYAQTYEYSYDNITKTYKYYVPFEFIRSTDVNFISQYIDTDHIQFDRWCVPESIHSPVGGQCGDGNINIGEQCDPPGRRAILSTTPTGQTCPVGSYVTATCSASCTYTYSACTAQAALCGNGRVEGSEQCDAGAQNGQYGSRCTSGCTLATVVGDAQFCGNNKLDKNAQGRYVEFCEEVNGACLHIDDKGQILKTRVHILLDRSGSMVINYVNTSTPRITRWASALSGLDQIYTSMSGQIDFSLSVFPASTGSTPCYRDLGRLTQLPSATLNTAGLTPTSGVPTPTKCAFQSIFDAQNSIFTGADTVPKKVILITDGAPSDTSNPAEVASNIKLLNNNNVSTYVIGFSNLTSATDKQFLNTFADAGGTDNPNSPEKFFVADKSNEFVTAFGEILGCFEYSQFQKSSCAWNCQGYGEYCGDRIVQTQQGEECDLGAQNGSGSCTNYCKILTVTPGPAVCGNNTLETGEQCDDGNTVINDGCSATCTIESTAPRCGDGKVDPAQPGKLAEQCDGGIHNGEVCTPGYDKACTYCTNACTKVTVDATAFCGNGNVDYTTQISPLGLLTHTSLEKCDYDAQGVYGYSSSASLLLPPNGRVEKKCPDKGSYTCTNSCQLLSSQCVTCDKGANFPVPKVLVLNPMVQPNNLPPSYRFDIRSYRKNPPLQAEGTIFALKILGDQRITSEQYTLPFSPVNLFTDTNGLETNLSCNGEYALLFNRQRINSTMSDTQIVSDDLGDLFDYQVHGEGGEVVNEVVASPAVPRDQIRIVTRWKKSGDIDFTGQMYQDKSNGAESPATIAYIAGDRSYLCESMGTTTFNPNYYSPVGCLPTVPATWMHKILNPPETQTAVQAITMSAVSRSSDKPIGFFVSSPNGPINQYTNYDLWVDVYTYHSNAAPLYSIYQPTYSFSIKDAIPSTDTGILGARYWHVFNLTISGTNALKSFNIIPIGPNGTGTVSPGYAGQIVQNTCRVRANMPLTTQCGAEPVPFSLSLLNVSATTLDVPASAGSASSISVVSNVNWTVTDDQPWLSVTPASGSNTAPLMISYTANTATSARVGTITVTDGTRTQTITVTQAAAALVGSLTVSPPTFNPAAAGGTTQITVTSNVSWTVSESLNWVSLSHTGGSNNGTFFITVTDNSLVSSRTGEVTVTGGGITRTITVTQAGVTAPVNSLTLSTAALSPSANSGGATVGVTSNVSWTVTDDQTWLSVTPTGGSNNGAFTVSYTANTGSSRIATITVAGGGITKTVTVTQAGTNASFTVSPSSVSLGAASNSNTTITITSNASWSLSDDQSWLTMSQVSGSGNAIITVSALSANNSASTRTATITVSVLGVPSQTVTVTQAGKTPSSLTVSSPTASVGAAVNSTASVTVSSNVSWSVVKSMTWLSVTPLTGTSGNITLNFITSQANISASPRSGTVTISGGGITRIVDVTQAADVPSLTASPTSINVSAGTLGSSITVTSNVSSWNASSNQSWLTVSSASGSNNGTITLSFPSNGTGSDRTAIVTISGGGITRTVNVTQAAIPSLTTSPGSLSAKATDSGNVTITVNSNVTWTLTNGRPSWITITSPTSGTGTGNGSVTLSFTRNTGLLARTGLITISGGGINRTFTLNQAADDSLTVSPTSFNVTNSSSDTTKKFTITSNVSWSIGDNAAWLNWTPGVTNGSGTQTFTLSYPANTGGAQTGIITITGPGLSQTVTVNQAAGP